MRRGRVVLGVAVLVLLVLPFAADPLIAQDPLHPADAIVIIGGDHKPDRVAQGVALYEAGYAPYVILSAGTMVYEGGAYLPEAEVLRSQALALGLPSEVILMEDASQSTRENALFTREIAETEGFDSLLVVTSTYHSQRTRHIFQDAFADSPITLAVQPAHSLLCTRCWWLFPDYTHTVFYEYYNWARLGIESLLRGMMAGG